MIVKSVTNVGIGAIVRIALPSGAVTEDKVLAIVGDKLILGSGRSVDPAKQHVKVVGSSNGMWRALEGSEREKKEALDRELRGLDLAGHSFPGSRE